MNQKSLSVHLKTYFRFMNEKIEFGQRLRAAMARAGYALRPVVLEREFNTRYWGRSVTLQAARRWLRGEAIPLVGRIVAVADVFDALISARPYKAAMSCDEARAIIERGRDKHFDPDIIDNFLAGYKEFEAIAAHYGIEG